MCSCVSECLKCACWEAWKGNFQSLFYNSNPAGSWYNSPMTHLCLVIIPVSGLFAYSSCRHVAGETPAFKSLVHHDHFRICASWRLSWNAFMSCCGLLDGDQWRLCRKREIQDGIKCWLQTPAEKLSAVIFQFQNNCWPRGNYLFPEPKGTFLLY